MIRLALTVALLTLPLPAAAEDIAKGRELAEVNCSPCHQVAAEGESPLAAAPPFRELGRRYPVTDLEEALVEGITTAHPRMPEFAFEPADAAALIAYLQSIQER
jgi:mono/diheme cytochrome c family protein